MFAYLSSHWFTQCSFHLRLCTGWGFFFLFFPGTFPIIFGPDGEGHGSTSFVWVPLWKEVVLLNVISITGRVHFGPWKKTIGLDTSRLQNRRVHLPTLPPLTKGPARRILIFDQWRVEVLIRPHAGQRPPPPPCPVYPVLGCCWHLLPEEAQERWGGLGIKREGAG